ncbi:uncharacterized protein JCM15063_001395 [Sporobolomyces koalae]|uniref:uncharacterized protein n=1 Tax=Sporobolomyces koalae TaxID=500713 RepID=UPI0031752FBE
MRFRAEIANTAQLTRLITSLAPLAKVATLKLKADVVHLICQGERGGVQVWSQIAVSSIFKLEGFRLESNNNNEIYLEVTTDALARALRSAAGSTKALIKLSKKGGHGPGGTGPGAHPVLSIDIESASRMGKRLTITQDVYVKVKKMQDVQQLKEPLCPVPDAALLLPPLQLLRTVAERMKSVSSVITLSANNAGTFRMRVEADEAKVETEWPNLKRPNLGDAGDEMTNPVEDPNEFFSVTVETKNLLKFLASYSIAQTTIFCLCPNHCAIFYVYVGNSKDNLQGGVLTFFVPAFNVDGDP